MTTTQTDHAARKVEAAQAVLATPDSKALGKVATNILRGLDPSELQILDLKALVARYEEKTSAAFVLQQKQAEQIFIDQLAEHTKSDNKRTVLVLDNASWHHAVKSNWHHVIPMYIPNFSSLAAWPKPSVFGQIANEIY